MLSRTLREQALRLATEFFDEQSAPRARQPKREKTRPTK
jgi:hypothetical protein